MFPNFLSLLIRKMSIFFTNCRRHVHSATLNLISTLQNLCLNQLCVMRKGCLSSVLLHYKSNSSHKSFTCDPCLSPWVLRIHCPLMVWHATKAIMFPCGRRMFREVNLLSVHLTCTVFTERQRSTFSINSISRRSKTVNFKDRQQTVLALNKKRLQLS